jgi:uncharacterized membrane protein (DUF2068 family)
MKASGPSPTRPKRPWRVTFFSLAVLLLGSGLNVLRAVWAWRQANVLADLAVATSMPMALLTGTSLAWGVAFGVCGLGLWRLRSWGRRSTLAAVTLFHVHIWFNHIAFDRSDYARQVWPFAIVHTLVTLLVVWVFLLWPATRRLYSKQRSLVSRERINDPGSEDQTTA